MPNDGSPTSRELPWVIVRVGRSRLGLPSGMVREMMALPVVSRVPGLPPDLPGVITWRGQVVPLVDLRVRLQEPDAGRLTGPRMSVVISPRDGERERAFAVDGIDGVEALEAGSHTALPEGLEQKSGMVREFGRLRRDGTLVLLLDVCEALGIARTEDADTGPDEPRAPAVRQVAPASGVSDAEKTALLTDAGLVASDGADDSGVLASVLPATGDVSGETFLHATPRAHRTRTSATPRSTSSGRGSRSPRRRTAS